MLNFFDFVIILLFSIFPKFLQVFNMVIFLLLSFLKFIKLRDENHFFDFVWSIKGLAKESANSLLDTFVLIILQLEMSWKLGQHDWIITYWASSFIIILFGFVDGISDE